MRNTQLLLWLGQLLASGITRTKAFGEGTAAFIASILQFVCQLFGLGPTKDIELLKQILFRRLDAGTRSLEADADKKAADAKRALVEVVRMRLPIIRYARQMHLQGVEAEQLKAIRDKRHNKNGSDLTSEPLIRASKTARKCASE